MGASNFSNLAIVKGDAREAYNALCEEMRDYNGHQDGYSGDIQTTSGYKNMTSAAPRYDTKAFYEWEDEMLEDNGIEKWGNCGYVELKGTALKKIKERRGLKGRKGYRAFYFFGWAAE